MATSAATATVLAIPIVLGGEVRGAFFEGNCDRPGADVRIPMLPELAPGPVRPLVLSTGNLLGPEPLSSLALEGPPAVYKDLLSLLIRKNNQGVFDGVLPGEYELSAHPVSLARLNFEGRTPWTVANTPLAAQHRRYRVFLRNGIRIGLTAVLDERLVPSVSPSNQVYMAPASESLTRSVQVLRRAGVHLVVAMIHTRRSYGLSRVIEILKEVRGPKPDVVLTSPLASNPSLVQLHDLKTLVIPAPQDSSSAAVINLNIKRSPGSAVLEHVEVDRVLVDARPSELADLIRNWACLRLDIPLDVKGWHEPISRSLFRNFVLERMRQVASAEVAIISSKTLGLPSVFPLPKSPTRMHLRAALPSNENLQVANIRGSAITRLEDIDREVQVHSLGITSGQVAGRPIDPRRIYRVVTVDFLADGGDVVLNSNEYPFRSLRGRGSLREIIATTLETSGFDPDSDPDLDDYISEPGFFDVRVNLGANFKSVNVENRSSAEAPQLARQNFLGLSGDFELRLIYDLPKHRFEVSGRTRFGGVQEAEEDSIRENEDITVLELDYSGDLAGGLDRPWLPDAGATARLETELTIPEDERDYRRGLLQIGVGPSWRLTGNLLLSSQLGIRREIFASEDARGFEGSLAETKVALLTRAELRDEIFDNSSSRPVLLNIRLDFASDLSGSVKDQVLQGRVALDVPITASIALTVAMDVYTLNRSIFDSGTGETSFISGAALDTSFGIKSSADFSRLFR